MADVTREQVIDFLSNMSVIDLSGLVGDLESKWGVTAAAAVAAVAGPGAPAEAEEEQTEFSVVLTDFGDKKINVIKAVREITGAGLKEAKDMVEGVPSTLKEATTKEDATALIAKITEAGGKAEMK